MFSASLCWRVICHNVLSITPFFLFAQLLLDLNKCTNWDQKLDYFVTYFSNTNISLSTENLKILCMTIYQRLLALQKYDVSSMPPLRTPIILLKPTLQSIQMSEEDYGLRKVTARFWHAFRNRPNPFSHLFLFKWFNIISWNISRSRETRWKYITSKAIMSRCWTATKL